MLLKIIYSDYIANSLSLREAVIHLHQTFETCLSCICENVLCCVGSPKAKEANSKSADSALDSSERSGKF